MATAHTTPKPNKTHNQTKIKTLSQKLKQALLDKTNKGVMNHDPKRIESNPNPKPRIGSDRETKSMAFFSCRNRRYDNYLPEPLPLPCVRRRPARISSPEDAVDPPELARPHRLRSFVPKSTVTEHATESANPMSASKIASWVFTRSYVHKDPSKKEIKFLFSSLWVPS